MMVSTGNGTPLTGNDSITDRLLTHVSHFVIGPVRKQFATGPLGLRDEQYDNIEEENNSAERINREVLRVWRNKFRDETVQTFIDKLVLWHKDGYVTAGVWENIGAIVDLANTNLPTAMKRRVNTPITGSDPVTDKLLSHVSHFVIGPMRKQFATGPLGLSDEEYDNIEENNSKAQRRNYEVLRMWRNNSQGEETVKSFTEKLLLWQEEDYITGQVWHKIGKIVEHSVIPSLHQINTSTKRQNNNRMRKKMKEREVTTENDNDKPVQKRGMRCTAVITLVVLVAVATAYYQLEYTCNGVTELQKLTKQSLDRQWRNSLSHDWIPRHKARKFPLRNFYVDLKWSRQVNQALRSTKQDMENIYDILKVPEAGMKPINILIEGEAGIGKTSSMASIALNWTDNHDSSQDAALSKFDLVFLIQLRYVDKDIPLVEVIRSQHDKLDEFSVQVISKIILGKTKCKVLLLMDGLDEYRVGTNREIDRAIDKTIGNCLLVLTARPGYMSMEAKAKMDGEVTIEGFRTENVQKYSALYLESDKLSESMLQQANNTCIDDLLRVPIYLLMISGLFYEKHTLPKSKTETMGSIFDLSIDRSTLKEHNFGLKSDAIEKLHPMLFVLGKASWQSLQLDSKQLLLNKEELEREEPDIMKLGLLNEIGITEASVRELPAYVSFSHKLLQDYAAALYINQILESSSDITEEMKHFFPTWNEVIRHNEVVRFTCGTMSNCKPFADYLYMMFIDSALDVHRIQEFNKHHVLSYRIILESLYEASKVPLPDHALHNKFIHWFNINDNTIIKFPSKLYIVLKAYGKRVEKGFIRFTGVYYNWTSRDILMNDLHTSELSLPDDIVILKLLNVNMFTKMKTSQFSEEELEEFTENLIRKTDRKKKWIFFATTEREDPKYFPPVSNECNVIMFIAPCLDVDPSVTCALLSALSKCISLMYLDLRGNTLAGCPGKELEDLYYTNFYGDEDHEWEWYEWK